MRIVPIVIFVVLLIVAMVFVQEISRYLPERVASHFAADGHPNGYMSREGCRIFMLEFTLGAPLFLALLTGLIPWIVPVYLFNLPNRDYWMAAEREKESRGFLSEQGVWFACILLLFLCTVDWMVAAANTSTIPQLPASSFTVAIVIFLTVLGFWLVRMVRRFGKPS